MNRIKLFFALLFNLLSWSHFSQEINQADMSFSIHGEQYALIPYRFGFAVLTPEGYYDSEGNLFDYSSPFPEELKNLNLRNIGTTQLNNTTYILYPGGGMLFSFKEGALIREDLSFAHSNYYDGYFFSHKNHLYHLGGYGLWTTKRDLLRFNFEFKEWEKVEVSGEYPQQGFWSPHVVLHEEKLYVVLASNIKTSTQETEFLDKIYSLDLSTMVWNAQQEFPKRLQNRLSRFKNFGVQNGHTWVVFPSDKQNDFTVIDPLSGEVFISPEKDFIVSSSYPLFIDNQMITLRRKNQGSPDFELKIYPYNPTEFTEKFVLKRPNSFRNILLISSCGVLFFVILIWRIFLKAQTFTLYKDRIGLRMRWVSLNEGEYFFLRKMAKYGNIKNNEIVHFFSEEGKSQDLFVKRKNAMIKNLEMKLKAKFKKSFFSKTEDPNDKRFYVYSIAPKIIIKYS